jgi:decaprenylphospho-beta-D-erythro-pentofuranosid-2-ulose 2-reductase
MKNIIIVGATSAIAQACARKWVGKDIGFFLVGRNPAKLDAIANDLRVRGASSVSTWNMDANDVSAYAGMLDAATTALGRLDVALIAHGTLPNQSACEEDPALTMDAIATNGISAIALLTVLANYFERQRSGSIGVITSVAGDRGRPSNYTYGAAKSAVSRFCEGLSVRLLKSGVSLTDIRPGFVDTPMTKGIALPALLLSTPENVAGRIVTGIERGTPVLYVPRFWAFIMFAIRTIPVFIFRRMSL